MYCNKLKITQAIYDRALDNDVNFLNRYVHTVAGIVVFFKCKNSMLS